MSLEVGNLVQRQLATEAVDQTTGEVKEVPGPIYFTGAVNFDQFFGPLYIVPRHKLTPSSPDWTVKMLRPGLTDPERARKDDWQERGTAWTMKLSVGEGLNIYLVKVGPDGRPVRVQFKAYPDRAVQPDRDTLGAYKLTYDVQAARPQKGSALDGAMRERVPLEDAIPF